MPRRTTDRSQRPGVVALPLLIADRLQELRDRLAAVAQRILHVKLERRGSCLTGMAQELSVRVGEDHAGRAGLTAGGDHGIPRSEKLLALFGLGERTNIRAGDVCEKAVGRSA